MAISFFLASVLVSTTPGVWSDEPAAPAPALKFDLAQAVRDESRVSQPTDGGEPPVVDAEAVEEASRSRPKYGVPSDHDWISVFAGYANDFDADEDYNLTVAWSTFIARELEFAVEAGGWYFDQEGQNTGGVSALMDFRWHFLHDDEFNWTIYGDAGIGLLAGFDEVPDGGTGFNFVPRIGAGFTHAIGDDGTRLQIGVRWHHISNGRIEGDERNPGRDSVMVYAGVIFPF